MANGTYASGDEVKSTRCHHGCSMKKKAKKESDEATLASVKSEMAKPRIANSAREAEMNLFAARIAPNKP